MEHLLVVWEHEASHTCTVAAITQCFDSNVCSEDLKRKINYQSIQMVPKHTLQTFHWWLTNTFFIYTASKFTFMHPAQRQSDISGYISNVNPILHFPFGSVFVHFFKPESQNNELKNARMLYSARKPKQWPNKDSVETLLVFPYKQSPLHMKAFMYKCDQLLKTF